MLETPQKGGGAGVFWAALDALPEAIVVLDPRGTTVHVNVAGRSLLEMRASSRGDRARVDVGSDGLRELVSLFSLGPSDAEALSACLRGGPRQKVDIASPAGPDGARRYAIEVLSHHLDGAEGVLVRIRELDEQRRIERDLRDSEELFHIMTNLSAEGVVLIDGGRLIQANDRYCEMFGYPREEVIGAEAVVFVAPESRELIANNIQRNYHFPYEAVCMRKDGTFFPVVLLGRPVPYRGRTVRGTTVRDVTAEKQAEEALRRTVAQEEQIRAQAQRLAELSTPLIPITDEIVVMPLIGSIDAARAGRVIEALLDGVVQRGSHTAILDITGVAGIDTQVTDFMLRVARAVRLLGAEVVLTGIRPEVAQTVVGFGVELAGIVTKGTLQSGIAYAMAKRQRKRPAQRGDERR